MFTLHRFLHLPLNPVWNPFYFWSYEDWTSVLSWSECLLINHPFFVIWSSLPCDENCFWDLCHCVGHWLFIIQISLVVKLVNYSQTHTLYYTYSVAKKFVCLLLISFQRQYSFFCRGGQWPTVIKFAHVSQRLAL